MLLSHLFRQPFTILFGAYLFAVLPLMQITNALKIEHLFYKATYTIPSLYVPTGYSNLHGAQEVPALQGGGY